MVILHGALSRLHGISYCFGTSQPVVKNLHIATAFILFNMNSLKNSLVVRFQWSNVFFSHAPKKRNQNEKKSAKKRGPFCLGRDNETTSMCLPWNIDAKNEVYVWGFRPVHLPSVLRVFSLKFKSLKGVPNGSVTGCQFTIS